MQKYNTNYLSMKTCKQCKISKELSEFYPDKRNKDGLRVKCITCVIAQDKISRRKRWQKHLAMKRKWYNDHIEVYRERNKRLWQEKKHVLAPKLAQIQRENAPYRKYQRKLERMGAKTIEEYKYQKKANEDHDIKHGIVWGQS